MRKNHENTNGFVQATHKEVVELKEFVRVMASRLDDITSMVEKATFQSVMQGADISEFFPVERNDQLDDFMDRTHPDWPSRRCEFYNFLYTVVSDCKRSFSQALIKAIFSRPYISKVKWPASGYLFFLFHVFKQQKNNFLFLSPRKNQGPIVPTKFVAFLRASLAKMAGYKYIKSELIDAEFWSKMPLKFTAVKFYDKSVVSII